ATLAVPVSMGVAILKYRLYDIARVLSRTLAYAIVTGLLIGVCAGLVLLAQQVRRFSSPVAVAASTLAAAALFNPVRRRVQRGVDRRFNRARYDADQAVAAFAARLQDAVDLDTVPGDLAGGGQDPPPRGTAHGGGSPRAAICPSSRGGPVITSPRAGAAPVTTKPCPRSRGTN